MKPLGLLTFIGKLYPHQYRYTLHHVDLCNQIDCFIVYQNVKKIQYLDFFGIDHRRLFLITGTSLFMIKNFESVCPVFFLTLAIKRYFIKWKLKFILFLLFDFFVLIHCRICAYSLLLNDNQYICFMAQRSNCGQECFIL